MTTRSIFKRSLTAFNSEFSFSYTSCLTKAEDPSLSYYLHIAGGRIIGFIPFPRFSVLCVLQSVSSRIWTRVAVSITINDNHYTTGTSNNGWYAINPNQLSNCVKTHVNELKMLSAKYTFEYPVNFKTGFSIK